MAKLVIFVGPLIGHLGYETEGEKATGQRGNGATRHSGSPVVLGIVGAWGWEVKGGGRIANG